MFYRTKREAQRREQVLRPIESVIADLVMILGRDRRRQIDAVIDYFGESREARSARRGVRVSGPDPGLVPGHTHDEAVGGQPR